MSESASIEFGETVESGFLWKLFYVFACLAGLSLAISICGRLFGHSLAMGDYSESTRPRKVILDGNILLVPENTIRFGDQRRDGAHSRLDLYLKWPEMSGYRAIYRDAFNFTAKTPSVIFLSIQQQVMSRDMSGRFAPIYSSLIEKPGRSGPAGLTAYRLSRKSGYIDETLLTGEEKEGKLFVTRCLETSDILTACERDILVGKDLSLTYRFPKELLDQWRAIDRAVESFSRRLIQNRS